jgi:hypothetical protein
MSSVRSLARRPSLISKLNLSWPRAHPELITYVNYLMNFDSMEHRLQEMVKRDAFRNDHAAAGELPASD